MPGTRAERIVAVVGAAGVAFLAVMTALAWLDYRHTGSSTAPAAQTVAAPSKRRAVSSNNGGLTLGVAPRRPAKRLTGLVLRAARGDSWVAVHAIAETGPTVFEGTLSKGQALHVAKRRVWLRVGAPLNLNATVNGRRLRLPTNTASLLLSGTRLSTLG